MANNVFFNNEIDNLNNYVIIIKNRSGFLLPRAVEITNSNI